MTQRKLCHQSPPNTGESKQKLETKNSFQSYQASQTYSFQVIGLNLFYDAKQNLVSSRWDFWSGLCSLASLGVIPNSLFCLFWKALGSWILSVSVTSCSFLSPLLSYLNSFCCRMKYFSLRGNWYTTPSMYHLPATAFFKNHVLFFVVIVTYTHSYMCNHLSPTYRVQYSLACMCMISGLIAWYKITS